MEDTLIEVDIVEAEAIVVDLIEGETVIVDLPAEQGVDVQADMVGERGAKGDAGQDSIIPGPAGVDGRTPIKGIDYNDGLPGAKGDPGEPGQQGIQGEPGGIGDKGPDGDKGLVGDHGPQGEQGNKGESGEKGSPGDPGDKGTDGDQGPSGEQGSPGITGNQGPDGGQGVVGDKGTTGDQGEKGIAGDKGITGDTGTPGTTGDKGPSGDKGLTGDAGGQGEQGYQGDKGLTGDSGEPGTTGDKGAVGDKGLTGDQGPVGDKGSTGDTGPPGAGNLSAFVLSGALYENIPRNVCAEVNTALLSSGRLSLLAIWLPAGITVTSISFWSATTAGATLTNQLFGLYSNALALLRVSVNDGSAAWAANTRKTLALATPFVTLYAGLYYLGIMVAATTVPTVKGHTARTGGQLAASAPSMGGTSNTGLTTSLPNPCNAPATVTTNAWGCVN